MKEYRNVYLKEEPFLSITENTTDKMIDRMSLAMTQQVLTTYAAAHNLTFPPNYLATTTHVQLVEECKKIRNTKRASMNLPPVVPPDPDAYKRTAPNTNGNHLSKYLPKSTAYNDPRASVNNSTNLAHRFDQNDFFVRVNVPMRTTDVNIPSTIKQTFATFRRADPSFCMMPFDRANTSKNDIISKESSIRNKKDDLTKWVKGIFLNKNNRLSFSIRATNNIPFRELRSVLNIWMKETTSKVNFDKVLSKSLFPAGWLKFAHPRILNRDSLYNWILSKTESTSLENKIHMYPRNIFEYRGDGTKVITEVLAIDGAFEHKKQIMEFFCALKWDGYYEDVVFMPFQKDESVTKDDQIESLDSHNDYCSKIASEVITVKQPGHILDDSVNKFTFLDWLATHSTNNVRLFYEVEQIGVTKVVIAYFDNKSDGVRNFLDNIQTLLQKNYGDATVQDVFGANNNKPVQRSDLRNSSDFSKECQKIIIHRLVCLTMQTDADAHFMDPTQSN